MACLDSTLIYNYENAEFLWEEVENGMSCKVVVNELNRGVDAKEIIALITKEVVVKPSCVTPGVERYYATI